MKLSPIYCSTSRWALLVVFSLASLVFAGTVGCDNVEVQTVVLGGLQDLAVTLVDALFLTLQPEEETTPVTTTTTPVTWIMDTANAWIC